MTISSLLASVRPLLTSRLSGSPALPSPHPACVLFFSLCDGDRRAQVCQAIGTDFAAAWKNGVVACQKLVRTRKFNPRWLRVDWVVQITPTSWAALQSEFSTIKRNYFREGLAFDPAFRLAFLEQEINANAVLYGGNNIANVQFNAKNFDVYAKFRYGKDFALTPTSDTPVWRFTTAGLFVAEDARLADLPGGQIAQLLPPPDLSIDKSWKTPSTLNCSRRQIHPLGAEDVLALIRSASQFLAMQVNSDGQFIYGHFPCFGRLIPAYNALRHASTLYSMLESWELTRDETLLAAIQRALTHLAETLIRRYPQASGGSLAFNVEENGEIKLGANAVSLLALVKYDELTGDTRYRPLMEALALGIAYMQDDTSGKFVHVLNAENLTVKEAFRIVYYDGEAAFGLMRLYGLTQDSRWLKITEKAFEHFIQNQHWQYHDHWLSYCANELTRYRPEEKYFRFAVDNIAGYLDFILERETTYPTLLELCMAFAATLQRIETRHPEMRAVLSGLDIEKFHRALHYRAHYLLNGFFWPELAMYFAKPSSIVGSFFIRHHSFRVRIDDVEHYLSGYVAYRKFLLQQQGEPLQQALAGTTAPNTSSETHSTRATPHNAAATTELTILPIRRPACLNDQQNGNIRSDLLCAVRGGRLLKPVARHWNAMRRAALADGIILLPHSQLDTYRPLNAQIRIFESRYEPCPDARPDAVSWNNRSWYLKEGSAPAAIPGTSKHGWGLSIDVRLDSDGKVKEWLLEHACRFGFCWENQAEPWHLTFFPGDTAIGDWSQGTFEQATRGTWLRQPAQDFTATGISAWEGSYHRGNAVVLGTTPKDRGIQANRLQSLPFPPSAIITSMSLEELQRSGCPDLIPVYQVRANSAAVMDLARFARRQFRGKVIGVTGSAGKTTTTYMLAHALSAPGREVPCTRSSANLPFGVAWNLCQMPWDADFYVLELAVGNMENNTRLARPDVAIITNIAPAHLEYHGTTLNIARKKSRIFLGVADEGSAVIQRDTEHAEILIAAAREQGLSIWTYGQHPQADIRLLDWDERNHQVHAATPAGELSFSLQAAGLHMAQNALACVATAFALKQDPGPVAASFASFRAIEGRGQIHELQRDKLRISLIDESYNANPLSMQAAIDFSNARFRNGSFRRNVMILGDMLELGPETAAYHVAIGDILKKQPPDLLLLIGPLMARLAPVMQEVRQTKTVVFESIDPLLQDPLGLIQDGDQVLVKSSHGTGLHRLVSALIGAFSKEPSGQ